MFKNKEELLEQAFDAIREGDTKKLIKLIKKKVNLNLMNKNGETLLQLAIKKNRKDIVKLLIKNGIDVNIRCNSTEFFKFNPNSIFSYLLGKKQEIKGLTPLMVALNVDNAGDEGNDENFDFEYMYKKEKNIEIISLLIDAGADINAVESRHGLAPIHFASKNLDLESLKLLFDVKKDGETVVNTNAIAFKNGVEYVPLDNNLGVAPIALALDSDERYISSRCIDMLIKNGANIKIYKEIPDLFTPILSILADKDSNKASEILFDVLDRDFSKIEYSNVKDTIDNFLKSDVKDDNEFRNFTEILIGKDTDFSTLFNDIKYFSHLKSWSGNISGDFTSEEKNQKKEKHLSTECEGWQPYYQSYNKVKSLLYVLKGVREGYIDCNEKFNENKEAVMKKLRNEIYQQVTTFFSTKHLSYYVNIVDPNGAIDEAGEKLNIPAWYFNDKPDMKRQISSKLIKKWSEKIGELKVNESFSIISGTIDHACYIEFKKNSDNTISRIIYNLGGGNESHNKNSDGRVFPHVVSGINQELFTNEHPRALSYLYAIIGAQANTYLVQKSSENYEINPQFMLVYEGAYKLGGQIVESEYMNSFIPMKQQVCGNCSVKNNFSAMKNRMGEKISEFVKEFEIEYYKNKLNISEKLYNFKEMEKDIKYFELIRNTTEHEFQEVFMEKNLYRFFEKRSENLNKEFCIKHGDRIAEAIEKTKNPKIVNEYFNHYTDLFDMMNKVANYYNSDKLKKVIKTYSKEYEISKSEKILKSEDIFYIMKKINPSKDKLGINPNDQTRKSRINKEVNKSVNKVFFYKSNHKTSKGKCLT